MKTFGKTVMALLAFSGAALSQPIEKSGACPEFQRANTYNGVSVNFINAFANQIRPPQNLRNAGQYQVPLTPQQSINCVLVPPGLKPQIIASELTPGPAGAPPLAYLMNFTFDEKGRMWAVEPRDYPYMHDTTGNPDVSVTGITTTNGLASNRTTGGRGRIVILEDTNGDGAMDHFKVFYDGLVLPTSLEIVKNGVVVTVPPTIYFIPKDVNNPDTAGAAPTSVVSNMGSTGQSYDTHGQTNSLTRGIDNWIYVHNGYNNCGTPAVAGGNSVSCPGNGSIQRFKSTTIGSDTNRIELYGPSNQQNAHGIGTMEDGQWFKSHATITVHTYHIARPNVHRDTNGNTWVGATSVDIRSSEGGSTSENGNNNSRRRFFAITRDRYMWEGNNEDANVIAANPASGNIAYISTGASAVSGHDFYTARLLPQKYWNRFAFTCEGLSGLCNQDSLVRNGSTWSARRLYPPTKWPNIFASTDAWTAPLKVRTGPDGALWVLDWYNYMFLHNPANPATNAAYRNPLRHKSRVRMYRIIPENGTTQPMLDLTNANTRTLVNTLYHTNMVWRMQAQRLLVERGYNEELGNLLDSVLTLQRQVDAVGLDAPVIHALWTLHGLKQFQQNPNRWNPILKNLLLHPAWTVRRNVVQAMPASAETYAAFRDQCIVNDEDAQVRLMALVQLARIPASGNVIQSLDGLRSDNYITSAYNAAGAAKVTSASGNARPASCPAYLGTSTFVVGLKSGETPLRFRPDVRFNVRAGGFELLANQQLPSGELVVHDLRGKAVFRSVWNHATGSWSRPSVNGLAHPLYFYNFRAYNGERFNGRIPLAAL